MRFHPGMNVALDRHRYRKILAVRNLRLAVGGDRLIETEELNLRIVADRRRIGVLDRQRLPNAHKHNMRMEHAKVVIQHDRLLELGLIVWVNFNLLTETSSKINHRVD